ncbi:MAG: RHS repeat-associated core domain-containing protein, partial [Bergeyella sp.]
MLAPAARSAGDTGIKRYGYVYDRLNRLTAGLYQSPDNPTSKEHSERITYDGSGNITTLKRSSYVIGTAASLIDNLSYTYTGNRITAIADNSGDGSGYEGGGNEISYDANGNMTDMQDKGISSIAYNYLNLADETVISQGFSSATVTSLYRADGVKLKKVNTTTTSDIADTTTTTYTSDYLDGFQYLETSTTRNTGEIEMELTASPLDTAMEQEAFLVIDKTTIGGGTLDNAVLQFFPTAEGFYDYQNNLYIYQYKDHLGNVRVSYTKNSGGGAEVLDKNDYYPFG